MNDTTPAPNVDESNLNPLSSAGALSAMAFAASLLLASGLTFLFGRVARSLLAGARAAGDEKHTLIYYGAWLLISSVGFWIISSVFVKRWARILTLREAPRFVRFLVRASLLSPLLSGFLVLFTLALSGVEATSDGAIEKKSRGLSRWQIAGLTLGALGLFHCGLLVYRLHEGELRREGLRLRLASATPLGSLKAVLPASAQLPPLPDENFYIHLYPYVSPAGKYALSLASDFARAMTVAEVAGKNDPVLCATRDTFAGVKVENCYFSALNRVRLECAFSTPLFALLFEARAQQSRMSVATPRPNSQEEALAALATSLLPLENLTSLLESSQWTEGRLLILKPLGLLPFIGSPELPILEFGQDLQRNMLTKRLVPVLEGEFKRAEGLLGAGHEQGQAPALNPALGPVLKSIEGLKNRLAAISADPLQARPAKTTSPEM